ncbi:MAG: AMP-binding protein [Pseudomonadota bacterium]
MKKRRCIHLGELVQKQAQKHANRCFAIQAETGLSLTYLQFNQKINQIAHALHKKTKLKSGDFVGIMLDNSLDYLCFSYALKKLNLCEIAINTNFKGILLARMLNLADCKWLILEHLYLPVIYDIISQLKHLRYIILVDPAISDEQTRDEQKIQDAGIIVFNTHQINANKSDNFNNFCKDDRLCVIMFTSGTTGTAKGCMISHRGAIRAAESVLEAFDLSKHDRVYSPYPQFHVGASHYDILPAMLLGASVVLRRQFSVTQFWTDVAQYEATWFMALGSVQQLLWAAPTHKQERHHKLRFIWGTPLPIEATEFEARFNVKIFKGGGYGSTDAGAPALPLPDKKGAGKIRDCYQVAIVDEDDQILPSGKIGELVIRPNEPAIMFSGYFGLPELTCESWRNLWFHTGDLAKIDQDGDLIFISRMSERIRVKGNMVAASEIEEILNLHPAIQDTGIIGVADESGEEQIYAFITLRPSLAYQNKTPEIDIEELIEFCKKKMSRFMIPAKWHILERMPMTPSGKIARGELKKIID